MSRKKTQPKKVVTPDPIFNSTIIPKLINSIMYDGKKVVAEKIVYEAIEKIKSKTKEEPINVFNEAINNIKPTVEVRSRRVGGATYQVPVEVKTKRAQALAIRWQSDGLLMHLEKEKINTCQIKFLTNCMTHTKKKVLQLKKEKMYIKWQSQTKLLLILGGNKLWLEHIH